MASVQRHLELAEHYVGLADSKAYFDEKNVYATLATAHATIAMALMQQEASQ